MSQQDAGSVSNGWLNVGREEDFAQGLKRITMGKQRLVVGRVQGRLYAFDAICPHAGGPMELSEIDGAIVSCPLHAWRFDLEQDGKELHGYRPLSVKKVRIENGSVYVAV